MPDWTIEELAVPETLDDSPAARDFRDAIAVRNACWAAAFGSDEHAQPAELTVTAYHHAEEPTRLWVVRVGGRVVARGIHETRIGAGSDTAWLVVQVHPEHRGRGIGGALADHLDAVCRESGQTKLLTNAPSTPAPGPVLPSPTGFGSVPADGAEVGFLLRRGWRLEQVNRGSRFPLPADLPALRDRLRATGSTAGPDYRLHEWAGATPGRWLEDVAMLFTRMSSDAPSAGLEEPAEIWTPDRVLEYERLRDAAPVTRLTAVVEHVPSGRLAGLTELQVPDDLALPADQHDTIVIREHRGHRLGMLLKVANLLHLSRVAPGHPSVVTFNAEENRYMLDVNEAVGFVPAGYVGSWRKDL